MTKTQAYNDFEKEEYQLVRVIDFLSTKMMLSAEALR